MKISFSSPKPKGAKFRQLVPEDLLPVTVAEGKKRAAAAAAIRDSKDGGPSCCCWPRSPLCPLMLAVACLCVASWCLAFLVQLVWLQQTSSPIKTEFVSLHDDWEMDQDDYRKEPAKCDDVPVVYRFDCFPSPNATKSACLSRGCCWSPPPKTLSGAGAAEDSVDVPLDVPYCFYPAGHQSHAFLNYTKIERGVAVYYRIGKASGYPRDVEVVRMDILVGDWKTLRIKIYDPVRERYQVPQFTVEGDEPFLKLPPLEDATDPQYKVLLSRTTFGFKVLRWNNEAIFDTFKVGSLVFSDQLLQISTLLPSHFVFGLGEHNAPLLKSTKWTKYTMWNFDMPPYSGSTNLYGSHPFYMVMEKDGQSHGVFLRNSNAMEVTLQPTPALTFRTTGGILDLFFFLGPHPTDVVEQYTALVGRPFLPPFWSLGYHQCKFGYKNLAETNAVLRRTQRAGIPIDVQWNDLDYMDDRNDFTVDEKNFGGIKEFVDQLHDEGLHYVTIVDPGVSGAQKPGSYPPYDRMLEMGVYLRNSTGGVFVGRVWNRGSTVWPDFTHPNATDYWAEMFGEFHRRVPIDGAWIDMNEPSNFEDGQLHLGCPDDGLNHPPYVPRDVTGGSLFHHTACPSARHHMGSHYDLHNLFGLSEAVVTNRALRRVRPGRRPFIISRSSAPGLGRFSGHWTGDIHSDWGAMSQSIAGVLNFNLLGVPMVGADICGFNGNTTAKLCQRWMELGAFYPFSRNHNSIENFDQDPVAMGPEVVRASVKALRTRYALLPYLYTLFVNAHLKGHPVARPLFMEFPLDQTTYGLGERQFMLGPALMVAPVLEEDATSVDAYIPGYTGKSWWDWHTNEKIEVGPDGKFVNLEAPLDEIRVLARGGSIIAKKEDGKANTTTQSRGLPFLLRVYPGDDDKFTYGTLYGYVTLGELYHDDGVSLDSYEKGEYSHLQFSYCRLCKTTVDDPHPYMSVVRSYVKKAGYTKDFVLEHVAIFDVDKNVTSVTLNDKPVKHYYVEKSKMLGIPYLKFDLSQEMVLRF